MLDRNMNASIFLFCVSFGSVKREMRGPVERSVNS